jgi:hypothetical protein
MAPLTLALRAFRELGPGPLALYGIYQTLMRTGWLRIRTPSYDWSERPLASWTLPDVPTTPTAYAEYRAKHGPPFFLKPDPSFMAELNQVLTEGKENALKEAEEILAGRFRLFGGDPMTLGFPPDWTAFPPLADIRDTPHLDLDRHWTTYDLETFPTDVKLLWEGARFGWVYPLARAYWLTEDDRYYQGLGNLIDSWRKVNEPNTGPHWISAQEIALRVMALVFVSYAFAPRLVEDPEQMIRLTEMIAAHAERIPATLTYARSQNNNHLLVEAVALYTVGTLFPEFRSATRCRKLGRRWLIEALNRQIFPDGGYVQHSTNYQRLAIQAGLWACRIAEANDEPLIFAILDALRRMTTCLYSLVDQKSGKVPNFGPNDGGHILPFTICPFDDFRPVIQAAGRAFFGETVYPPGPWDEACIWLGMKAERAGVEHKLSSALPGADLETRPPLTPALSQRGRGSPSLDRKEDFKHAGLYLMGGHQAWGMLRCAQFTSRPGHSDQLHFDLWWGGRNIACDPGTYLYNGAAPWDNGLVGAQVHNTVVIDDQEPMLRAGRFLWLDWSRGDLLGRWRSHGGGLEVLSAVHNGYRRIGVVHRRTVVRAGEDLWIVIDDLCGEGSHTACAGWLLPDGEWRLEGNEINLKLSHNQLIMRLHGAVRPIGVYRAGVLIGGEPVSHDGALWGWRSSTYATKEPALRIVTEVENALPLRLETWWSFNDAEPLDLTLERLDPCLGSSAVAMLEYKGERLDIEDAHTADTSGVH